MIRIGEDDDGRMFIRADADGIGYLIEGLEELREAEPGTLLTSPTLVSDQGRPAGVADCVLERFPDA